MLNRRGFFAAISAGIALLRAKPGVVPNASPAKRLTKWVLDYGTPGGSFRTFNIDGGDLGMGSFRNFSYMKVDIDDPRPAITHLASWSSHA